MTLKGTDRSIVFRTVKSSVVNSHPMTTTTPILVRPSLFEGRVLQSPLMKTKYEGDLYTYRNKSE